MKIEHIKIGETYKIVGRKCGCGGIKCRDCTEYFPEHLIKVISKLNENSREYQGDGKYIGGEWEGNRGLNNCHFAPEDLEPIQTNWRERLENGI